MQSIPAALVGSRKAARFGFLSVEVETYRFDEGDEFERIVIRHPGAVAVVPVLDDGVVLMRQFRAPLRTMVLEIPAGKLDVDGEPPSRAAARECEEETGYRPGRIEYLRTIHTTPGFTDERIELFLATELVEVGARPQGAEEQHAEIIHMTFAELRSAMAAGSITDAKTLLALNDVLARYNVE
ncbi:MAG TPA: NUDIX hydrolase [Acidimicrobiia bacterium]|nr:NUDIX hydrolase [Acidimicrobiia bacterium]